MDNIQIIEVENFDGTKVEHVIIDKGNNEFTSMLKETWDKLQESSIIENEGGIE